MSVPSVTSPTLPHYTPAAGKGIPFDHMTGTYNNTLALYLGLVNASKDDTSTGTLNNYDPGDNVHVCFTGGSSVTVTGVASGVLGRKVFVHNNGTSTVQLTHLGGGSSAGNQIKWPSTSGQMLGVGGVALLEYTSGSVWRGYCVDPGQPCGWTPTVNSSGGGAATYTTQVGRYVQFGNIVTFEAAIALATAGTLGAGNISIALPFTSANVSVLRSGVTIGYWANLSVALVAVNAFVVENSLTANLYGASAATTSLAQFTLTTISGTFNIYYGAAYIIA